MSKFWVTQSDRDTVHGVDKKLDLILAMLKLQQKEVTQIMATLDALEAQVKANTDVEAGAVVLIQQIAAMLEAAKTDPAKVQALADSLKASADNLAAAITANTPAA